VSKFAVSLPHKNSPGARMIRTAAYPLCVLVSRHPISLHSRSSLPNTSYWRFWSTFTMLYSLAFSNTLHAYVCPLCSEAWYGEQCANHSVPCAKSHGWWHNGR